MRLPLLSLFLLLGLIFTACEKMDNDKCHEKQTCDYCDDKDWDDKDHQDGDDDNDKGDTDKASDKAENDQKSTDEAWEKTIVEPLVLNEDCGCYTAGIIKYVSGDDVVLVKYDNKDCDGKAYKIYCDDGDCESEKAKCCVFNQKCKETAKLKD